MPDILYHASLNKNLTQLEPQRTLSKDMYIGDYVFATQSRLYALMYLAPNATGTKLMKVKGEPYVVINCSASRFKELDKGGAIYTVSADTFGKSPQTELADSELVSAQIVKPLAKEVFDSAFRAMVDAGITVYFLDDDDFEKVLSAGKCTRDILASFTPAE